MKRRLTTLAAAAFAVIVPSPAYAVPAPMLLHDITVEVPGYDGCTFRFAAFSWVEPQIHGDGTVNVVEVGAFKVTPSGENCGAVIVPSEVHIYDRSVGHPTYFVSSPFGARQDVEYKTAPTIADSQLVDRLGSLPENRLVGVVTIQFRAPDIGVCIMDTWTVASAVAAPIGNFVPCPEV